MVNIYSLEMDRLRQAEFRPRNTMMDSLFNNTFLPDRSQPEQTMITPTVEHQDVGVKYTIAV